MFEEIKHYYRSIKVWLKYHKRLSFWKLVQTVFQGYPWDYGYLTDIEEAKLKEMLYYHEHSHIVCEESRLHKIKTLKLALRMLYIIKHETDYFGYDGEMNFIELDEKDENGEPLYEWDGKNLTYHCDCIVNIKNYKRFFISDSAIKLCPHELYIEKARYLYHKIRLYYEQEWWD